MTKDETIKAGGNAEIKGVEDDSPDRKQSDRAASDKDANEPKPDRAGGNAEIKGID